MPETVNCPYCSEPVAAVHLYVRGIGASLSWSKRPDVPLISRHDLTLINLETISSGGTGMQAIIPALRCESCGAISFRAV